MGGPMRALATVCVLACTAAAEEPAPTDDEARRHFDAGQRAFADGDYDDAVSEFEAAWRAKPHPDVEINIATSYERVYKPREAREHYERFLRDAPPDSPLRSLANYRLRVLRSLPGSILVDATKPGAEVRLVGEGRDEHAKTPHSFEKLPPGRYRIHVELAYHAPQNVEVTLDPGAQSVVNVPLEHLVETLTIFSRPSGARVFLDDREEGVTPFSRPVEVGRQRKLRVEAEDFPAHLERIDVSFGQPVRKNLIFRRPFRSGRSELVLASMIYGGSGSVLIAEAAGGPKLDGVARLSIDLAAVLVGVGAGFLASALTTDDYVKVGHSSMIIGGTAWGAVVGASLSLGLKLSDQELLGTTLLGSALGLGGGVLVARVNDTSPGDAAIVNSGGTWGSVAGVLVGEAIPIAERDRAQAVGWLTLAGCVSGLTAAAFVAWGVEVSRGHVAVVDAFGMVGLALSFAVGYGVAESDGFRVQNGSRYGLGGVAVGLLVGAIVSRKFKDDLPPTEALLTYHRRWAMALPQLRLDGARTPEGRSTRMTIDLVRGEF